MPRSIRRTLTLLIFCLSAGILSAQTYTSILVFGDSLSDTGNVANLSNAQYHVRVPGPLAGYTDGSFTDGTDTLPPATLYEGVWIKQLAATFPARPPVVASLDGGTNYAYGYAFTGTGTTVLTLPSLGSVDVKNIGQQVADYLAAHPTVPANTLVVVWGGANDLMSAASAADITTAATNELAAIQALVAAGATDLLIPNLPPLGATPDRNMNPTLSAQATAASQAFNAAIAAGIAGLPAANPGKTLHLFPLDVFSLFTSVIASPAASNLTNVTDVSQREVVNPDTYLFWDDIHPTTAGHHLLAVAAAALVAPPAPSISAAASPTSLTVTSGASTSSTITVTPANGYSGAVTLACSGLPANASCGLAPASLTFTSTVTTAQTSVLTISTNSKTNATAAAFLLLPLTGFGALLALRRRGFHPGLLLLVVSVSLVGALGLSGCGDSGRKTPKGTYTVPITITPASGTATTLNISLIVQ